MIDLNTYASLGYNCEAAYQFRRVTGHDEASFFNWTFCRLSCALNVIKADFSGLLEWDKIFPAGIMIYDATFDLAFHGDVFKETDGGKDVEKVREYWHALREKLAYLAERWRKTAASEAHTTYFLKLMSPEHEPAAARMQAAEARDVLLARYPNHKFTIVVVQSLELVEPEDEWGEDRLYSRYVERYAPDTAPWEADVASWDRIFAEFPLQAFA